jgi:hypothetical protein
LQEPVTFWRADVSLKEEQALTTEIMSATRDTPPS